MRWIPSLIVLIGAVAEAAGTTTLNGSGATFPKAFYEEAIAGFHEISGVALTYAGGGSGKGRQDLADRIVDWAGTDSPIPAGDLPRFEGGEVLYFPTVVAPITVSYNVPGVSKLHLSCATIAKIFQKQITTWNDPALAAENAGNRLPATPITLAVRSDASGTTDNFSKYLDKACGTGGDGTWKLKTGSTIAWAAGVSAGNGNTGVAQIVKSTPGAVGYVDLSDAKATGLTSAAIQNRDGRFVAPTVAGASAAAAGATIEPDLTFSAVWAPGADAYPITAQTWILVYRNQTDRAKGQAIQAFLHYMLGPGQALAPTVDFGALPKDLDARAVAQIERIQVP